MSISIVKTLNAISSLSDLVIWYCSGSTLKIFSVKLTKIKMTINHQTSVFYLQLTLERRHDKNNKVTVRPAKTQISLGIRPVWSESSLCAQCVGKDPSFLHADSEDSDQTGRMPRLIWVLAGRTVTLLVLSCRGSFVQLHAQSIHSKILKKYLPVASLKTKWNSAPESQIKLTLFRDNED